jgi:DNA-binding PadR family transcriptional regulator
LRATHKGDLSASMAILGLLIQEPDTAVGVGQRLAERFPRARFARSAVHNALPSLQRQGLVRVLSSANTDALDRYCATGDGSDAFRQWIRSTPAVRPALRDAMHARLAFAGREDLLDLIEAVAEEERACEQEYAAAHARIVAARPPARRGDEDWNARLQRVIMGDELTLWLLRLRRLQRLHAALEDLEVDGSGRNLHAVDPMIRGAKGRREGGGLGA